MPDRPLTVALVIGEESGDQLGAGLIDAIRRLHPGARFIGLAGHRMQVRGMQRIFPIEDVAVMGLGAILAHLPRIVRRVYQTVDAVVQGEPDVLVIIDSPDFTHAVAKRVARRRPDIPIIDYVSPSVWAWRASRAPRMARFMDHVLALLPFEPAVHERLGGPPCTYVGHPLIERLGELRGTARRSSAVGDPPVLLVLPGSRRTEITRLMEPFGKAVGIIAGEKPGIRILLPAVSHLRDEIAGRARSWPVPVEIVDGEAAKFAAFQAADAAVAASGTVTLELGLAGVPMVVAYRVDPVARVLKRFLKVPSIVLTNLILGENVIPEYLDEAASPEVLARETLDLLEDGPKRRRQIEAFARLDRVMALPDGKRPSDMAAGIVVAAAEGRALGPAGSPAQRRAETGM
jgi:lipid-A-disaccharide synthase